MTRITMAVALPLALLACSAPRTASDAAHPAEASAAAARAAAPPHPLAPAALLGRASDEGEFVLRTSVLRAHPLGAEFEPYILAWPGWAQTISGFTSHPLTELDWIVVVGPVKPSQQRLLARTSEGTGEAIDVRLEALAGGSTENAASSLDDDVRHAAAARLDGSLRVVVHPKADLVVVARADAARPLVHAVVGARVADPQAQADDVVLAEVVNAHQAMPQMPEEARRIHVRVASRPAGSAEVFVEMNCDDEPSARRVAAAVRALTGRFDNVMVRLLTHDLLNALTIAVDDSTVRLHLLATREQLEAGLRLANGFLLPAQR